MEKEVGESSKDNGVVVHGSDMIKASVNEQDVDNLQQLKEHELQDVDNLQRLEEHELQDVDNLQRLEEHELQEGDKEDGEGRIVAIIESMMDSEYATKSKMTGKKLEGWADIEIVQNADMEIGAQEPKESSKPQVEGAQDATKEGTYMKVRNKADVNYNFVSTREEEDSEAEQLIAGVGNEAEQLITGAGNEGKNYSTRKGRRGRSDTKMVRRSARVNTGDQPLSTMEKMEHRARIRTLELGGEGGQSANGKGEKQ